jgi:diguanylate cyclase (GGDEF)-like protein
MARQQTFTPPRGAPDRPARPQSLPDALLARDLAFDAVITADAAGVVASFNAAAADTFGNARLSAIDRPLGALFADESQHELAQMLSRARRGELAQCELVADGPASGRTTVEVRIAASADPATGDLVIVAREARGALARQATEQRALAAIGERALRSPDIASLLPRVAAIVADTLHGARVRIAEQLPDGDLELRAGSGHVPRSGRSLAADGRITQALAAAGPVVVDGAVAAAIRTSASCWGLIDAEAPDAGPLGADDAGFLQRVAIVLASAIERRRADDLVRFQALHDPLTGIANRTLLIDHLEVALERVGGSGRRVAVLLVDIDGFRAINDELGQAEGDAILVRCARLLDGLLRPGDTVARIGGDRFALVHEGVADEREARELAERVVRSFRRQRTPAATGRPTVSVGVVLCGVGGSPEAAIRDAHTAAHRAKAGGRDRMALFDSGMRSRPAERNRIAGELRASVEQGRVFPYYQPIIDLQTRRMVGVEALARWDHPERGIVGPRQFIPLAEETGVIDLLGRRILERACRDAAGWHPHDGGPPLTVSVNISPLELAQPSIVEDVLEVVRASGLEPGRLGLEITESVVLVDDRRPLERLEALRAGGVRVILDDFGTGYSSLAYLRRIPLDVLKLDRSFVKGIGDDPDAIAIVGAVTRMAETLSLEVIAEGVQTVSELRALEGLGCGLVQGYVFARPMNPAKLARVLEGPPPWLSRGRAQEPA